MYPQPLKKPLTVAELHTEAIVRKKFAYNKEWEKMMFLAEWNRDTIVERPNSEFIYRIDKMFEIYLGYKITYEIRFEIYICILFENP